MRRFVTMTVLKEETMVMAVKRMGRMVMVYNSDTSHERNDVPEAGFDLSL